MHEHYDGWKVGDFITEMNLSFYEGNVIKYVCRHRLKDGKKDLLKAKDYIEQLLKGYDEATQTTIKIKDYLGSDYSGYYWSPPA